MTILITGGAGFIGGQLALHYRDLGYKVTIFDNLTRNSIQYFDHKNIEIIKGNILYDLPKDNYDMIIHCAGICGIHSIIPSDVLDVNSYGTKKVIDKFKDKCERLLIFSSCEVEGIEPNNYTYPLFEPRWSYAISKVGAEYYSLDAIEQGYPITIIRPVNIYGIGQVGDSAIVSFISKLLEGQSVIVYNDGLQIRSWLYIDDFIEAIDLILENKNCIGKTYSIGNINHIIILKLLNCISKIIGQEPIIEFRKSFCTDIRFRMVDISEITNLGFVPKVTLQDGLSKTVNWWINTFIGI